MLQLADVPPEREWLANITNSKTRRAYKIDVEEFSGFAGLQNSAELRTVARAHVIAWRKDLKRRELEPATIRRKLYGVKRPMANGNEGSTPALGDGQARTLLEAPPPRG